MIRLAKKCNFWVITCLLLIFKDESDQSFEDIEAEPDAVPIQPKLDVFISG